MHLQEGDYATKGARNLAMVDEDSFWIAAFVEETKLAGIQVGAPAVAALMGYRDPVRGRVESIARSVNTPNTAPGALGLASVDPVFIWVCLAQRIPVRIRIDQAPDTVHLESGITATVTVGQGAARCRRMASCRACSPSRHGSLLLPRPPGEGWGERPWQQSVTPGTTPAFGSFGHLGPCPFPHPGPLPAGEEAAGVGTVDVHAI